MRGNEFLDKIGMVDPKYIEEADTMPKRKHIKITAVLAACLAVIMLIAVLLPMTRKPYINDAVPPPKTTDTEEADINYPAPVIYDGIPYSELDISDTGLEPGILDIKGGSADIASFDEKYLADYEMIIAGRVKDVRIKHYEIITDFDKFGDGGRTHFFEYNVVYDIEVEKVYKGDIDIGEIFVVEDNITAPRNTFYLKEGHRYVIPIVQTDEHWGYWHGNIVEGSVERDSMYYNPYTYHPQIEITEDGYYLFSDDWTTLASSESAVRVTMDIPFDYGYQVYFNDRMMLIDGVTFEEKMNELVERYS